MDVRTGPAAPDRSPPANGQVVFRRVCAIVQRCLHETSFETEADLKDAVKTVCAQQGLRFQTGDIIRKAIDSVQHHRREK